MNESCRGCVLYVGIVNPICKFQKLNSADECPCRECLVRAMCNQHLECDIRLNARSKARLKGIPYERRKL